MRVNQGLTSSLAFAKAPALCMHGCLRNARFVPPVVNAGACDRADSPAVREAQVLAVLKAVSSVVVYNARAVIGRPDVQLLST